MARPNVFGEEFEYDETDPDGDRCGVMPVGSQAGGRAITVKVYEMPPGHSMCPYWWSGGFAAAGPGASRRRRSPQ